MSPTASVRGGLGPHAIRVLAISTLVIVLAALITIVGAVRSSSYELRATFNDARGLIAGGEVQAGGITVGRIRRVFLNDDDLPEAVMEIDKDFRVHEGARANLRLGSNAGVVNRVVDLTQGDRSAPELRPGATLGRGQTDEPVNFDEAATTFNPRTRADLREFIIGLDRSTRGRGGDIAGTLRSSSPALNETADLLAQANVDLLALRTMVRQGARAVSALASSPEDVAAAIDETGRLLRTTGRRHAELRDSVRTLDSALVRTGHLLGTVRTATPNLRRLVRGVDPLVTELGRLSRVLIPARRAAGPFLKATRRLVVSGPGTLRGLRPIIAAAFPVTDVVGPLATSALPLAQSLRAYAPDIAGFLQNFGSAIGGYDAAGHSLHIFASVGPPQDTTPIDGSDCGPGVLKPPFVRVPGVAECEPWSNFRDSFLKASP